MFSFFSHITAVALAACGLGLWACGCPAASWALLLLAPVWTSLGLAAEDEDLDEAA